MNQKTSEERVLKDGDPSIPSAVKVVWRLAGQYEVEIVKRIFDLRVKGNSLIVIAKTLNDENIQCVRNGRWRGTEMKWNRGTIRSIIENPAYYGARAYNQYSMSKIIAHRTGREVKQHLKYPNWRNSKEDWVVQEGVVDREANKFRFEIRKVPAVTPELEKHFATHKPLTISLANLVSARSSGGRRQTLTGSILRS